jgi:hypothetical protein
MPYDRERESLCLRKAQKPFHPSDRIRPRRLDHQMKMIRHEDISVNLPAGLDARLGEGLDPAHAGLPIRTVEQDRLAPVDPFRLSFVRAPTRNLRR